MAITVASAFDGFRKKIELSGDHRETCNTRRDNIVSRLEKTFTINKAFSTGSIPRFTAIASHSDLDVMVVLHFGKHIEGKTPAQVLSAVRNCLGESTTKVRRDGQAITMKYTTWPWVDVVPVSNSVDANGKHTHYNVPDSTTGNWIVSKPHLHDDTMSSRNSSFGVEFKRMVKMLKHWNYNHGGILSGYHCEILALRALTGTFDSYSWDVYQLLKQSYENLSGTMWHEGSWVDSYLTDTQRQDVRGRLERAKDTALQAWSKTYGASNDVKGAIADWQKVFGADFPSYG